MHFFKADIDKHTIKVNIYEKIRSVNIVVGKIPDGGRNLLGGN